MSHNSFAPGRFCLDVTCLADGNQTLLLNMFQYAATFARSLSALSQSLKGSSDKQGRFRHSGIGEAVELLARKPCQYLETAISLSQLSCSEIRFLPAP
jgi:hypothetical protein